MQTRRCWLVIENQLANRRGAVLEFLAGRGLRKTGNRRGKRVDLRGVEWEVFSGGRNDEVSYFGDLLLTSWSQRSWGAVEELDLG